jgi:hypothetical protein
MDLKELLKVMGDDLVNQYGFKVSRLEGKSCQNQSTAPILQFLCWLENTPEAKTVLENIGRAPKQKSKIA